MKEDPVAQRIKRFSGAFEDLDGDYEIVSSMYPGRRFSISSFQESEETVSEIGFSLSEAASGQEILFFFKLLWSVIVASCVAWLLWRWINASHSSRFPEKDQNDTTTTTTTFATMSAKETVFSVQTACCSPDASEAGHRIQNLVTRFEQVKDELTAESFENNAMQRVHVESVKTTFSRTLVEQNATSDDRTLENTRSGQVDTCTSITQLRELDELQFTPCQEGSPPELMDEAWEESPPCSPPPQKACESSPAQAEKQSDDFPISTGPLSAPSTPKCQSLTDEFAGPLQPTPTPSTQLKFDASLSTAIQQSSSIVEETPQRFAQDYCQSFRIIQQEIVRSGVRLKDSSRAAGELTMLHQSSRLQELQMQKKQDRSLLAKYEDYLSKYLDLLGTNISRAFQNSILVCVLLEGCRHAVRLKEGLDYFSLHYFFESAIQMACGCKDDNDFDDDIVPKPSPYISVVSNYLLSSFDPWYQSSDNPFLRLLNFAYYLPCLLGYIGFLLVILVLHTTLRHLHCPRVVHQVLNLACVLMGLAQSPKAWMIAIRGLELYFSWGLILVAVSLTLCVIALVCQRSARSYILECQHQLRDNSSQSGRSVSLCHAGKRLAWLEDMSLVLLCLPPLVMVAVVLWVPVP